ncbi:metal-sulfur cluster assembly factor [Spirochaeta isovalerica]|uniref:Metal-sulfur cluster biosynthetic enzyme n=1 Tax=Spirochaeta isovalerica TaxID=150 RepID=A0A841RAX4_9SPIO|nr:metal-sulfur cluster assembly factor [Spirochaeta isovalerica]MBB6480069.1 metal-sulfur cluster biosynthetic enzyme [Spirochaeta isovalerica]
MENKFDRQYILDILRPIMDPDLGMSIVDLGLIVEVIIAGANVTVDMTLTTPDCPYGPVLFNMVESTLRRDPLIDKFSLNLVWTEPRTLDDLSDMDRLNMGLDI